MLIDESSPFSATVAPALASPSPILKTTPIQVSFSGFQGAATDWIAVAAAGSPPTSYVRWTYTGGGTSGTVTLPNNLPGGSYELRGFFNYAGTHSYTVRASQALTIASDAQASSRWLAYLAQHTPSVNELWAVRVMNGLPTAPARANAPLAASQQVTAVAWAPRGRYLTYQVTGSSDLFIVDMAGAAPGTMQQLSDVSWSSWAADGKHLAYRVGGNRENVLVLDLRGALPATPQILPSDATYQSYDPAWSPDGKHLAYFAIDPEHGDLGLAMVDASQFVLVPEFAATDAMGLPLYLGYTSGAPGWSADGRYFIGTTAGAAVWYTRVTDAGPEPMGVATFVANFSDILHFTIAPVGARYAIRVHTHGELRHIEMGTPENPSEGMVGPYYDFSEALQIQGWLPGGELLFRDMTGSTQFMSRCTLAPLAVAMSALAPSPDGTRHAVRGGYTLLRVRDANECWGQLYRVFDIEGTEHVWASDSRHFWVRSSSGMHVIGTVDPQQIFSVQVADGSEGIRNPTWGRRSLQIFYENRALARLRQVTDIASGQPQHATLSPAFVQSNPDPINFAIAPEDDYVAMASDFTQDGQPELYISAAKSTVPKTPLHADGPLGADQSITNLSWQPTE